MGFYDNVIIEAPTGFLSVLSMRFSAGNYKIVVKLIDGFPFSL